MQNKTSLVHAFFAEQDKIAFEGTVTQARTRKLQNRVSKKRMPLLRIAYPDGNTLLLHVLRYGYRAQAKGGQAKRRTEQVAINGLVPTFCP